MEDQLACLRRQLPELLGPPASEAEISRLEIAIEATLTPEIRSLYRDHREMDSGLPFPVCYLLPPGEAASRTAALRTDGGWPGLDSAGVFWADGVGDHAGVVLDGDMVGMVVLVDIDAWDPVLPRWGSVESFYDAILPEGPPGDRGRLPYYLKSLPPDYPRPGQAPDPRADRLAETAFACFERSGGADVHAARRALALSGEQHHSWVIALTSAEDPDLQAAAARALGRWDTLDTVERLEHVALSGGHNARLAAIATLREDLRHPEAGAALRRLRQRLPRSWARGLGLDSQ